MERAHTRKGLGATLTAALTFRVLMALVTSTTVTAAVAGPMTYQAAKARREVAAPAPTTTTTVPVVPVPAPVEVTPDETTTSTTTSTTTTTAPDAAAPTTAPPLTATGLFWSAAPDHASPVALAGGLGGYRVWIFVDAPAVAQVTYWWDDPAGSGPPTATTTTAPFDLDPAGVDLRVRFGLGRHSLLAEVRTVDGRSYRRLAEFDIVA